MFLNEVLILVGGNVSRQTIGRVLTTGVTSRHRSVIFKMASKFLVRYFPKKEEFPSMLLRIRKI